MKISLILACAGKGERTGFSENKIWQTIDGRTVIDRSLSAFIKSGLIDQYIITANENDFDKISKLYGNQCLVIKGGKTRTQSVTNALSHIIGDIVLIHDGARPFVTEKMIKDCIICAKKHGCAIPVIPVRNTILKKDDDSAHQYVGKSNLYSVQTPQGFITEHIINAYARAGEKTYNDDGEIYKEFIGPISLYDGDINNIKLTFADDFIASPHKQEFRFGTGFDCHKLVENRVLILGGINIPYEKGLLGHSDADVLTHAIMDAILSAYANRDIGYHFSDASPEFKDISSMVLLDRVLEMTKKAGYKVHSVSASIMAEKPKLLNHISTITNNLAKALSLPLEKIGLTATTLEGLGFVGREEGICVHATATLTTL